MLVKGDLFVTVTKEIAPYSSRLLRAEIYLFFRRLAVRHHHNAARLIGGTVANKRNAARIVENIRLGTVGKAAACLDKLRKAFDSRHDDLMVVAVIAGVYIRRTEKIGIKDARHTFFAQQNDRIGQRLEPGFNGRFQRLQRLRVVVVDKRDGVIWNSGKQRTIEDSAHVEIAALLGSVMEAVVKGDIEEHQLLVDQIEIAFQRVYIGVPVFRDNEEVGINRVAHMAYPVAEEPCRNVFGRIQTETIHLYLFGKPPAPIFQFLVDSPVSEFDIRAHEIIEVAVFLVDLLIPFAVAIFVDETENAVLIRLFDVVDAAEALQVPDEFGMRAVSAGKGEARIGVRLEILVLYIGAVIGIDAATRTFSLSSAPIL